MSKVQLEARLETLMSLPTRWTTERRELVDRIKQQPATM